MKKLIIKELKEKQKILNPKTEEQKSEKHCSEVLGKTKSVKDRLDHTRRIFKK